MYHGCLFIEYRKSVGLLQEKYVQTQTHTYIHKSINLYL